MAITVINVMAAYATGLRWQWWQLLFIFFLLGPLCGLVGASWLRRELVAVYLAFCIVKTVIQIYTAIFGWFLRLGTRDGKRGLRDSIEVYKVYITMYCVNI